MGLEIGKRSMHAQHVCSTCPEPVRLLSFALLCVIAGCKGSGPAAPAPSASGAAMATSPPPGAGSQQPTAIPSAPGHDAAQPVLSARTPELRLPSCSPCRFSASSELTFQVSFAPRANDQEVVELEIAARGGGGTQRLPVDNGWSPSKEFLLRAVDLDFDGVLDLGFGPVLGTPNLSLGYWIVDSKGGSWRSVGLLSNLRTDASAGELITTEKGGHAGMLSEEKVYRWQAQKLELIRSVEQVHVEGKAAYRRITRSFADGKQTGEKIDDVPAPSATELQKAD